MSRPSVTCVKATALTPFHYHSLAVPSGTATLAQYLTDRAVSYALASAMGALCPSPALPVKDYSLPAGIRWVLLFSTAVTLVFGVFPGPLLGWLSQTGG